MVEPKPTNQNARPMPWRYIWLMTIPNNWTQQCHVVRRDRKEKITRPSCFAVFFFSVDNEPFLKYLSPSSRARFGGRWSRSGNFSFLGNMRRPAAQLRRTTFARQRRRSHLFLGSRREFEKNQTDDMLWPFINQDQHPYCGGEVRPL